MEKNIFEGAYFGKPYKTRGEKKAIYINIENSAFRKHKGKSHYLIIEDDPWCAQPYNVCGFIEDETNFSNDPRDIISEWAEEVDENELDRLAEEFCDIEYENPINVNKSQNGLELGYSNLLNCYKAGYCQASKKL